MPNWMRFINKAEYLYLQSCKMYIQRNEMKLLKLLSGWNVENHIITQADLAIVSDKNFPIHPKIDKNNELAQFVRFMEAVGVELCLNKKGVVSFKDADMYQEIVKNHLKFTGKGLILNLGQICEYSHGRIAYETMDLILGKHYPKSPYLRITNKKWHIIFFLKHADLLYNFDEEHIYFP